MVRKYLIVNERESKKHNWDSGFEFVAKIRSDRMRGFGSLEEVQAYNAGVELIREGKLKEYDFYPENCLKWNSAYFGGDSFGGAYRQLLLSCTGSDVVLDSYLLPLITDLEEMVSNSSIRDIITSTRKLKIPFSLDIWNGDKLPITFSIKDLPISPKDIPIYASYLRHIENLARKLK